MKRHRVMLSTYKVRVRAKAKKKKRLNNKEAIGVTIM